MIPYHLQSLWLQVGVGLTASTGLTNEVSYYIHLSATYVKNKISVAKMMLAYSLDKNARYQK